MAKGEPATACFSIFHTQKTAGKFLRTKRQKFAVRMKNLAATG
jgi:hypothetical protein